MTRLKYERGHSEGTSGTVTPCYVIGKQSHLSIGKCKFVDLLLLVLYSLKQLFLATFLINYILKIKNWNDVDQSQIMRTRGIVDSAKLFHNI